MDNDGSELVQISKCPEYEDIINHFKIPAQISPTAQWKLKLYDFIRYKENNFRKTWNNQIFFRMEEFFL